MISLTIVLLGLLLLFSVIVVYFTYAVLAKAVYFKRRGVPYLGARFGSTWKFLTGTADIVRMETQIYQDAKARKAPLVGLFDVFGQSTPFYVVSDLDACRSVFIKDFDHFVNRRELNTQKGDKYFKKMLSLTQNEQWKETRMKLSPLFTTGKIRKTIQIFQTSSQRMENYLKEQMQYPAKKTVDLDISTLFSKYAIDVIANAAFGVDSKSWEVLPHQRSTFEKMSKQFGFQFGGAFFVFKFLIIMIVPALADALGLQILDTESENYFAEVIKQVIRQRRQSGERRDDFLQLMLDAQAGLLKADEETHHVMNGTEGNQKGGLVLNEKLGKISFDDDDIIANEMMFLNAGFDTTQTVLLFAAYSLSLELDVQEKLYEEVTSVLKKHDGKLTYDAITSMVYLDMVLYETMRLYPPSTRTERTCTKDYPVPGTNVVIEKGSGILIPICGVHRDSELFPHPEKFIPERFNAENKASRHPYSYMPFGHGPRNCIGMRFAWIKVKVVMAQLVRAFRFEPCSKTPIPVAFDGNFIVKPKGGMWLQITARE